MATEILEVSTNGSGYWYFEGNSDKLAYLDRKQDNAAASSWFCFEEPWVVGALELQKIGFTATQIMEAREDNGH